MKTIVLSLILFLSYLVPADRKVYVCDSRSAKKYHLKNDCKGLNRCTHQIIEVKEDEAKKKGFELCKFEQ